MIKIGILGDIGSGKSFAAKAFGYPVFNADEEVSKLYQKDRKIYLKLKRKLPKHISTFPIKKKEISKAIISNKINLKILFNNLKTIEWGNIEYIDMAINATSLGLNNEKINLDFSNSGKNKLFYDVIYNPAETNFLKNAKQNGNLTVNGKLMFVYQALEAFKLWHEVEPKISNQIFKLLEND